MKNKQAQLVIKLGRKLLNEPMKIQAKQLSNLVEDCKELIKEYMEKNNLTINAMGVKCKIHPAQLHLFLSGKGGLNLTTMQKIGSVISNN